MAYTTINKSGDYFNTVTWTGDGNSPRNITGVGFQPDMVWEKSRSLAYSHSISDVVRGANKRLQSNGTNSEETNFAYGYTNAFISDGFTVISGSSSIENFNENNSTYASWNWKANGAGSANTAGSINSTVSVNTTAGFSISTFTTLSSTISTVGHGLGVIPDMVIVKTRANSNGWFVYHKDVGNNKFLRLETTGAATGNTMWNDTTPTSSVFSINANNLGASTSVAYCFAEKQGYSKFGSYTGNGNADGPFIYTGFKPAFVMTKKSSGTGAWAMMDNKRPGYNVTNNYLQANDSAAEYVDVSFNLDLLSNGWKARHNNGDFNSSGQTYIYMAFAEAPLVGTNNTPCTAR